VRFSKWIWACVLSVLVLVVSACGAPDVDVTDMALDLETLEVEVPAGTLRAEAVPGAYVGAVNDDLYIAIIPREADGGDGAREAAAYLCDGVDVVAWLTGDVRDGQGTLTAGDTRVEIESIAADVRGMVVVAGGEPEAFTAVAVEGAAGFYQADAEVDDTGHLGRWIVLPDGSQRGALTLLHEDDEQQDITYLFRR
jgi:hypothetical protein